MNLKPSGGREIDEIILSKGLGGEIIVGISVFALALEGKSRLRIFARM